MESGEKRTLIFIEDGSFSYDNRVKSEAKTLVAAGYDVTVVCPGAPGDPLCKRFSPRLRVYFYPKISAMSLPGRLVEHFSTLFFGTILTAMVYIKHGFSVFHACNPIDILWMIALPYRLLGRGFIYDQHDLCPELYLSKKARRTPDKNGFLYQILLFFEKCSVRFADVVMFVNDSYGEVVVRRSGKPRRAAVIVRNGPDLTRFNKNAVAHGLKAPHEVLVGYLGNMNEQDGVEYLLQAAVYISRLRSNIRFVLVGSGASLSRLKKEAESMGIDKQVRFTGRLPHGQMIKILSACDICVQPDPLSPFNDLSTMNKAMEYMALEKPVVAFDLKETRITCGDAALYARPNLAWDLAGKIIELAENAPLRGRLGRMGHDRVKRLFSWNYSAPELLRAYESILSHQGEHGGCLWNQGLAFSICPASRKSVLSSAKRAIN